MNKEMREGETRGDKEVRKKEEEKNVDERQLKIRKDRERCEVRHFPFCFVSREGIQSFSLANSCVCVCVCMCGVSERVCVGV